ncbi:uncharacterized protein [Dysidea avara]|uniref:uncharacterized protein isoform X2 n=1 Tax=Dysidea avara TaxID=196820 RepID=UPI00331814F5
MKAYNKPTLPIFGERDVKKVSFGPDHTIGQQYDSLYDTSMTEYFNRPNIKKRLFQLGLTDVNGNAVTNTEQEKISQKLKQLLKEREDVLRKLRTRESTRIARLACSKVIRPCATCETHDRITTYLKTHSCPVHSNMSYQTALDSVKLMADKEVNLAKLEVENKRLKNLWNGEVLRMEEEALEQRLKYEKKRKQQVDMELDKLRQQKEVMKTINLEQIKINLYAKIRRRLGLQALLTTLREAEDGVTTTLFGKSGEVEVPPSVADNEFQYGAEVTSQQSRPAGNEFRYLPPPPSLTQLVRPVSAPPSQRTPNQSEILLDQSQHDQIKKRPSTSRGYRTADRGPYIRSTSSGVKQAIVSPLVSSATNKTVTNVSSGKFDPSTDTEEDLDDDTMPLEEADTILAGGLSNTEIVTPPGSMATLEEPSTSSKIQPQRQTGSALSLKPSSSLSSRRQSSSSEKKVNFSLTLGLAELPGIPEITEPPMAKEQCEADLVPGQAIPVDTTLVDDEANMTGVDTADEGTPPGEGITNTTDNKGDHPSTLTTNKPDGVVITQSTIDEVMIPQISSEVLGEAVPIATSQLVSKKTSKLSTSKSDSKANVTKKRTKLDTQKPSLNRSTLKPAQKSANTKQSPESKGKNAVQPSKKKLNSQWKQAILKSMKK